MAQGVVSICRDTQMHIPPVEATPSTDSSRASRDEGVTSWRINIPCPANPTPIERVRMPRSSRGSYRWEAPPYPKREPDTGTHDKTKMDNAKIPPTPGVQGGKDAPACGGYSGGPPSSQTSSWSQYHKENIHLTRKITVPAQRGSKRKARKIALFSHLLLLMAISPV